MKSRLNTRYAPRLGERKRRPRDYSRGLLYLSASLPRHLHAGYWGPYSIADETEGILCPGQENGRTYVWQLRTFSNLENIQQVGETRKVIVLQPAALGIAKQRQCCHAACLGGFNARLSILDHRAVRRNKTEFLRGEEEYFWVWPLARPVGIQN